MHKESALIGFLIALAFVAVCGAATYRTIQSWHVAVIIPQWATSSAATVSGVKPGDAMTATLNTYDGSATSETLKCVVPTTNTVTSYLTGPAKTTETLTINLLR